MKTGKNDEPADAAATSFCLYFVDDEDVDQPREAKGQPQKEKGRGAGMKAVRGLNKMHRRVLSHPKGIIRTFEKEVIEDLGVVAWTVRDWTQKFNWGKFRGLQRCADMASPSTSFFAMETRDAAAAHMVQNLKAKMQCVLQGGSWEAAWLLTGLTDPTQKKEYLPEQKRS